VLPVVGVHAGLDVDVETAALDGPGLHGVGGLGAQETEAREGGQDRVAEQPGEAPGVPVEVAVEIA